MYTITVEATFSAVHRLRLADGTWEPLHGHDWRVRATFSASALDAEGMVVDFHAAEKALAATIAPLQYADLNAITSSSGANPTAECVAKYIFDDVRRREWPIQRVAVTEAPGCEASFELSAV